MSKVQKLSTRCPNCNTSLDLEVMVSVNVTIDPELRDQIFSGTLNEFACRICGQVIVVESAVLYHDMDRGFAIQYYPESNLTDPSFYASLSKTSNELGDFFSSIIPSGIPEHLVNPVIVFSKDELIRQIRFHETRTGLQKSAG